MATTIFPSVNDVAPIAGDGKKLKEGSLTAWMEALAQVNFVVSGLTLPANSGTLAINVAAGEAIVSGFRVVKDAAEAVNCTANQTNHIYLQLTFDGSQNVTGAVLVANTTGIAPANAVKIGTANAGAGSITATGDARQIGYGAPQLLAGGTGPGTVRLQESGGILKFSLDGGLTWKDAGTPSHQDPFIAMLTAGR